MPRAIVMLVPVLLVAGCNHSSQVTRRIDNPDRMKSTLLQHLPPGTPLPVAKEFMQREGFTCILERNGAFQERQNWNDHSGNKYDGIDFLGCHRVQNTGSFLVARVWDVALVVKDGAVTNVLVAHKIDGP